MSNLTKAQVIALFLGTASAQGYTHMQILNGPAGYAASGTTCNGNADCTTTGEKCGAFQVKDQTAQNFCVTEATMCGALGNFNGSSFSVQCWETPAAGATAVPPSAVDTDAYLTAINNLITQPQEADFAVDSANGNDTIVDNILVSPKYNFQDSWWKPPLTCAQQAAACVEPAEGVTGPSCADQAAACVEPTDWAETDKPQYNKCFLDVQCNAGQGHCCSLYPDTNNRRCIANDLHNISVTVGPVTFTPTCPTLGGPATPETGGEEEPEPESAIDDIAEQALAEASEALTNFKESLFTQAKEAAGYDAMSQADKDAYDANEATARAEEEAFLTKLKGINGYTATECDDNCKAVIEADLLTWAKAVYESCRANQQGIACRKNEEIKEAEETARAGADTHYYQAMTVEARAAFDKARLDETERLEASLAAAWVKDQQPAAGLEGSSCEADVTEDSLVEGVIEGVLGGATGPKADPSKCTDQAHCCGDSRRTDGANIAPLENICVSKTALTYTDGLGQTYNHTCKELATKVAATAAAAIVAAYSLM